MNERPLRPPPLSRRRFLGSAATVAIALRGSASRAEPTPDGATILRVQRAVPATGEPHPEPWGYDGRRPGPTLRVRRGEDLRIRLVNDLAQPTSIHWHGVRVPNAMDGVPGLTQTAVAPGASFDYRFRPPDAGTFWYHAPVGGATDRGLHGALIVDEDMQLTGIDRDLVLILSMPATAEGPPVLVNGTISPDIAVTPGERVRVRLINATAARGLVLRIDGHAAWLVAVDGQPSEPFLAREGRVALGPGSRVDLVVDAARPGGTIAPIFAEMGHSSPIARLVYRAGGRTGGPTRDVSPPSLPPNPLPARIDLRTALRLDVDLVSRKPLDPKGPPFFTVRRGRAVVMSLRNPGGLPQVFHLHGHSFRHLDRLDDGWKPFWLDTFVVGPAAERIAFVADNPGKWLMTSRTLDRADDTGEAYFVVS